MLYNGNYSASLVFFQKHPLKTYVHIQYNFGIGHRSNFWENSWLMKLIEFFKMKNWFSLCMCIECHNPNLCLLLLLLKFRWLYLDLLNQQHMELPRFNIMHQIYYFTNFIYFEYFYLIHTHILNECVLYGI